MSGAEENLPAPGDRWMLRASTRLVDAVDELRLRCWARRNYVPAWERDADWHSVILEEMRSRDAELSQMDPLDALAAMYVPLEPEALPGLHPAHDELPAPNILRERLPAAASAEPYYF
jgi:hypothetical protein